MLPFYRVLWAMGVWLMLWPGAASAQEEIANVFDFNTQNRVTNQEVRGLLRDSRGFLWWYGLRGLYQFDGVGNRPFYRHASQPGSVGGNYVHGVCEGRDGRLWIATGDAGLSCYDPNAPQETAFTNFPHDPQSAQSPRNNALHEVVEDDAGNIWFTGDFAGITCYQVRQRRFVHHLAQWGYFGGPMAKDAGGALWLGTRNHGLLRLEPRTGRVRQYALPPPVLASFDNAVNAICVDNAHRRVYFTAWQSGLYALEFAGNQPTLLTNAVSPFPANKGMAKVIRQDTTGKLWIGHTTGGLWQYDPATRRCQNLTSHLGVDSTQGSLAVNDLLLDRSGKMWLATNRGLRTYFPYLCQAWTSWATPAASGSAAMDFAEDARGRFWLGLPHALAQYDRPTQQLKRTYPFPKSMQAKPGGSLITTRRAIYLPAYNGLYWLNEQTQRIEPLPTQPTVAGLALQRADVGTVLEDTLLGEPVLWIGSWSHGLFRYWVTQRRTDHLLAGPDFRVLSLARDPRGHLWVGLDETGLVRVEDRLRFRHTHFRNRPHHPGSLPDNLIFGLLSDQRGTVWLATGSHGLVRVIERTDSTTFEAFSELSDQPTPNVLQILEDRQGIFWLTTLDGLYLFDPRLRQYVHLRTGDGFLPRSAQYSLGVDQQRNVLFRVATALQQPPPAAALFDDRPTFPLRLTSFTTFERNRNDLLTRDSIRLRVGENFFSIGYAALNFDQPQRTRYRYRLEGFDPGWIEAGARRVAYYTNVPPGDYTFHLRVDLGNAQHFGQLTRRIHVEAAFWQTTWFGTLVLLALAAVAYAYYRLQLRKKTLEAQLGRQRAEMRQQEAEMRERETDFQRRIAETEMAGLRAQMNPHFIFNCLNSIKLYTAQNEAGVASHYLTKFSRLIRLVLENSRADKVSLANELEALQLYLDLEAMRFKEKVRGTITVDARLDPQYIEIPPLLLQPYVENAIWHGLMHKEAGGRVDIAVTQPQDHCLHVEITDDGVGRAVAQQYQSKSATRHKSFGLAMTSERIQLINQLYHTQTVVQIHDLVTPDGQPGGTRVTIEIPI